MANMTKLKILRCVRKERQESLDYKKGRRRRDDESRVRFKDAAQLALKTEEGVMSLGMQL